MQSVLLQWEEKRLTHIITSDTNTIHTNTHACIHFINTTYKHNYICRNDMLNWIENTIEYIVYSSCLYRNYIKIYIFSICFLRMSDKVFSPITHACKKSTTKHCPLSGCTLCSRPFAMARSLAAVTERDQAM